MRGLVDQGAGWGDAASTQLCRLRPAAPAPAADQLCIVPGLRHAPRPPLPPRSKSLGKAWVPDKLLNKLASRGRSNSQSIFEKVPLLSCFALFACCHALMTASCPVRRNATMLPLRPAL